MSRKEGTCPFFSHFTGPQALSDPPAWKWMGVAKTKKLDRALKPRWILVPSGTILARSKDQKARQSIETLSLSLRKSGASIRYAKVAKTKKLDRALKRGDEHPQRNISRGVGSKDQKARQSIETKRLDIGNCICSILVAKTKKLDRALKLSELVDEPRDQER